MAYDHNRIVIYAINTMSQPQRPSWNAIFKDTGHDTLVIFLDDETNELYTTTTKIPNNPPQWIRIAIKDSHIMVSGFAPNTSCYDFGGIVDMYMGINAPEDLVEVESRLGVCNSEQCESHMDIPDIPARGACTPLSADDTYWFSFRMPMNCTNVAVGSAHRTQMFRTFVWYFAMIGQTCDAFTVDVLDMTCEENTSITIWAPGNALILSAEPFNRTDESRRRREEIEQGGSTDAGGMSMSGFGKVDSPTTSSGLSTTDIIYIAVFVPLGVILILGTIWWYKKKRTHDPAYTAALFEE
jgi:hypothetical protein